ncbi:MAG: MG2 domain-containing protein, partial [Desulfobacterales bacterium]
MKILKPILLIAVVLMTAAAVCAQQSNPAQLRKQAQKAYADGNYKSAYKLYNKLCLEVQTHPRMAAKDLDRAYQCLQRLNRINELDDFRKKVISRHSRNWHLLLEAAQSFADNPHWGYMVAGKFERGYHRGGGQYANAVLRDRLRALQLMKQAMPFAAANPNRSEAANFYMAFAGMLMQYGGFNQAWRLQYLSDLSRLPDYEPGYGYPYRSGAKGAPVDSQGNPIYYDIPESFQSARSDGERWRWLLARAAETHPRWESLAKYTLAVFLHQQFGVQTMAAHGRYFPWGRPAEEEEAKKQESGPYDVHTLMDTETIAKLATGIRRFDLPDEFNYIRLFKELADQQNAGRRWDSLATLARIYENRRRYDQAVTFWQRYEAYKKSQARKRINQILNNWGIFEPAGTHPAGRNPTVDYRFRNGRQVEFTAYRIKVAKLLEDTKAYIRSNPHRLDRNKIFYRIGWRLVHENETAYLGERVARWTMELEPDSRHWDRQVTVRMQPALKKAGAYLLIARMLKGNTSRIIVWVNDTVIVKKPLERQAFYYVADAVNGKAIAGADFEFFGYHQKRIKNTRRYRIRTRNFTRQSDHNGQVLIDAGQLPEKYNWLVTVTTAKGRLAFLGFSGVWYPNYYGSEYNRTKTLFLTDRPVYRPGHAVKFKAWVRQAKYDQQDQSRFAGRHFTVYLRNPKGETVYSQTVTADAYGGFSGQFELPADAPLGIYGLSHSGSTILGGHTFRVEEYKKPEFEVKIDVPAEPGKLGEKIPVVISATYYFGAPVTEAIVNYKVLRSDFDGRWYPVFYWDWFYGPGYWWYGYEYPWYPGWESWGCRKPIWSWWPHRSPKQPEIVAEGQAEIGKDGTLKIEIDTRLAKLMHADQDHKYVISAEVRDQSRRTIAGEGEVLVARRPFKVYAWVDRGHYRVGDTVAAGFQARTLDGKPVKGQGSLKLLQITYKKGKSREKEVQAWRLHTDSSGQAKIQIQASRAGQYRLSYTVTDAHRHTVEGGYIFTVRGDGDDGSRYRFAKMELVPDKREYAPGDTVQLMINTDKKGAAVVFFVRPANGVYLPPQVIHMSGKSTIQKITLAKRDMPNFFVEAFSVYHGRVHSETREIVVPPEQRMLNVTVTPSKKTYRPAEKARLTLRLTDYFQRPHQGSAVITVYDRSVEYIAGGSNIPEIREFFWKWRRHHYPQTQSSLSRRFFNLLKAKEISMQPIGVFGRLVEQQKNGVGVAAQTPAETSTGAEDKAFAEGEAVVAEMAVKRSKPAASLGVRKRADQKRVPATDLVTPVVRSQFADTAFWVAHVAADENGYAEVSFTMPENLTAWKIKAWAMGHGTRVGEGSAEAITRKDVIVRLQAPRFFVEKDEVVLSANVHNYLKKKKSVQVQLEFEGNLIGLLNDQRPRQTITIPAQGEKRVDWRVKVLKEGEVVIRMLALTDEESDAMQLRFPVYVHGMAKQVPRSGVIRPDQTEASVSFKVPAARRSDQSRLELRYSPTLAGVMVDALPYLVGYPYGCTEQTLNRFLPTIMTQRILLRMGLDLGQIKEKQANLNPQEIGDDRHRARQWKRFKQNPVFDEDTVADMVKTGIKRLAGMQLTDGGWGWFSGYGEQSYPHTTAYVVHGLQLARENQ